MYGILAELSTDDKLALCLRARVLLALRANSDIITVIFRRNHGQLRTMMFAGFIGDFEQSLIIVDNRQ